MRRPTFLQGVAVAAGLALFASAFVAALLPFIGTATVARLLIPMLVAAYLVYLLPQSRERGGRVLVMTAWLVFALAAWLFVPAFMPYVLLHIGALWLLRSLYFYSGIVPSLLDITLSAFSAFFALAALHRTGSVLVATWSFFLLQALFVFLPASLRQRASGLNRETSRAFDRARRDAELALRQLYSN